MLTKPFETEYLPEGEEMGKPNHNTRNSRHNFDDRRFSFVIKPKHNKDLALDDDDDNDHDEDCAALESESDSHHHYSYSLLTFNLLALVFCWVCGSRQEDASVFTEGMKKPFLVFTNAGDFSAVESWVQCPGRQFDLFVNHYGDDKEERSKLQSISDKFRTGKGFKYNCLSDWLKEDPHLFDGYEAVAVLDDDMSRASSGKINAMFHILQHEELDWASPTWTGMVWNEVNAPHYDSYLRYQTWFDMGFVFWNTEKLTGYLNQHNSKLQGWHEDVWAWNYLGGPDLNSGGKNRSAVVDAIVVDNPPSRSDGQREAARNPFNTEGSDELVQFHGVDDRACPKTRAELLTIEMEKEQPNWIDLQGEWDESTMSLTYDAHEVQPIVPIQKIPLAIRKEASRCHGDFLGPPRGESYRMPPLFVMLLLLYLVNLAVAYIRVPANAPYHPATVWVWYVTIPFFVCVVFLENPELRMRPSFYHRHDY